VSILELYDMRGNYAETVQKIAQMNGVDHVFIHNNISAVHPPELSPYHTYERTTSEMQVVFDESTVDAEYILELLAPFGGEIAAYEGSNRRVMERIGAPSIVAICGKVK